MTNENPMLTMIREVCSLGRAEFERPTTPTGDPAAQTHLVAGLLAADPSGEPSDISLSLDLLAPRAPYFDRLVLDAIDAGIAQVVDLGAGYDDRSVRFRSTGVTFFELDLGDVISEKRARLEALGTDIAGVRLAEIDFASDDVAEVLVAAGHDADLPTLFFAEHLALFLEPEDVTRLVEGIARRAAAGSRFALTAETHPDDLDSADVVATVDDVMFGGVGPLHTIRSFPAWATELNGAGWTIKDADSTVVDHFPIPFHGQDVQIRTRFVTAHAEANRQV